MEKPKRKYTRKPKPQEIKPEEKPEEKSKEIKTFLNLYPDVEKLPEDLQNKIFLILKGEFN